MDQWGGRLMAKERKAEAYDLLLPWVLRYLVACDPADTMRFMLMLA
jgi:hypothetical protein